MHAPVHQETHHDEHADIHMPSPSYWPIVVSIGLALMALGPVFGIATILLIGLPLNVTSLVGVGIIFIGVYGWAVEPVA
jgi:cytochrome c oxidase subunit 1